MSSSIPESMTLSCTQIMGVLNVTPDSFYKPSRVQSETLIQHQAKEMVDAGANMLDIGGESSRPGAKPVGLEEELERVIPALDVLSGNKYYISIDTYRAETAREAIAHGAFMINDITALRGDDNMAGVIADAGVECVLMHMQGLPNNMQNEPSYEEVIDDICAFFEERIAFATEAGIDQGKIWLDPGFGFGKTVGHNLSILQHLYAFKQFGCPLLVGTSNKSTIGAVLNADVEDRLEGTAATVSVSICNGANAVRVHDVAAMAKVARMTDAALGRIHFD
jgi:dihydropteroate synthase